jgi:hypothetical protein
MKFLRIPFGFIGVLALIALTWKWSRCYPEQEARAGSYQVSDCDFGTISDFGTRHFPFVVRNDSQTTWRSCHLSKSCGCLALSAPGFPKDIIPGEQATIDVSFIPTGQAGTVWRAAQVITEDGVCVAQCNIRATVLAHFAPYCDPLSYDDSKTSNGDPRFLTTRVYLLGNPEVQVESSDASVRLTIGAHLSIDKLHSALPIRVDAIPEVLGQFCKRPLEFSLRVGQQVSELRSFLGQRGWRKSAGGLWLCLTTRSSRVKLPASSLLSGASYGLVSQGAGSYRAGRIDDQGRFEIDTLSDAVRYSIISETDHSIEQLGGLVRVSDAEALLLGLSGK